MIAWTRTDLSDRRKKRCDATDGPRTYLPCRPFFTNLISNALKFTRPRESAVIEVGHQSQDGRPVIFVRDNGVGFSMKYADKLFGVFQRLHRAEDYQGNGVGLAIVKRIMEVHGGRVWVESAIGEGATFWLAFPAAAGEAATSLQTQGRRGRA